MILMKFYIVSNISRCLFVHRLLFRFVYLVIIVLYCIGWASCSDNTNVPLIRKQCWTSCLYFCLCKIYTIWDPNLRLYLWQIVEISLLLLNLHRWLVIRPVHGNCRMKTSWWRGRSSCLP